jgi:hypothetical protein
MKKDLVKKRKRRTNLELAGISREHLRMVQRLAELVQLPADKVWADVVEIGAAGVLSCNSEIMQAREKMEKERKLREEHIRDLFSDEPKLSEPIGSGSAPKQTEVAEYEYATGTDPGHSEGPSADDSEPALDGSFDAVIGPGYESEADQVIGSVDPNGAITIG